MNEKTFNGKNVQDRIEFLEKIVYNGEKNGEKCIFDCIQGMLGVLDQKWNKVYNEYKEKGIKIDYDTHCLLKYELFEGLKTGIIAKLNEFSQNLKNNL